MIKLQGSYMATSFTYKCLSQECKLVTRICGEMNKIYIRFSLSRVSQWEVENVDSDIGHPLYNYETDQCLKVKVEREIWCVNLNYSTKFQVPHQLDMRCNFRP